MKPTAVIIDLDGTLCNSLHVNDFTSNSGAVDWAAWMKSNTFAPVNEWCRDIVNGAIMQGHKIIFLTARTGSSGNRNITDKWLKNNGFFNYSLLMREDGDMRPDTEIKREIYNTVVASNYEVIYAVDDKRAVCDMWRDIGITALHCADY